VDNKEKSVQQSKQLMKPGVARKFFKESVVIPWDDHTRAHTHFATALAGIPTESPAEKAVAEEGEKRYSFEIPPPPIPENKITGTTKTEVLIIGSGTAGLVCANSAVENGAKVVLISKSSFPVSRGGSNFAFNSRTMRKFGISFDISKAFKKAMETHSFRISHEKWWLWAQKSGEAMDWVCDKMEEAGFATVIEQNYDDPDEARSTYPGAHGWTGNGLKMAGMGQQLLVDLLAKAAQKKGVKIYYNTTAVQLVREGNKTGRVTAVVAKGPDGEHVKYIATKGIVLATGDFTGDKEMVARYCPMALPLFNGGVYAGDGHKMGLWIGAAWQRTTPNAPMILSLVGLNGKAPIVNRNGVRFFNEDASEAYTGLTQMQQPDMDAFAIWNTSLAEQGAPWIKFGDIYGTVPYRSPEDIIAGWDFEVASDPKGPTVFPGMPGTTTVKADTIEEVGKKLGLPVNTLKATIYRYNEFCKMGVDEDFGKRSGLLFPLDKGPFYGRTTKPWLLIVTGGLRTNDKLQALDNNDQIIPGLYAIGTICGDMFANCYDFIFPGHNLGATCITFGYLAGRDITKS
jgi:fumarate reductase flavoprotein subunit